MSEPLAVVVKAVPTVGVSLQGPAAVKVSMGTIVTAAEIEAAGALLGTNDLSDVANAGESRQNLHVPELLPVQAVATANVSSMSGLPTVDGFTLEAEQQVLLVAQTEAKNNGPWVVGSGAWTRPTDLSTGAKVKARKVAVINGTVNAHSEWLLKTNSTVTVGTTAQVWELLQSASVVSGSQVAPSNDATGATDTAAIKAKLAAGGCILGLAPAGENVFYLREQLVVPDGTNGTLANGFLLGLGKDRVILRQAAGANIKGPLLTTSNIVNNVGSDGTLPVTIKGFTLDVNAHNQSYTSMPEPNAPEGPDGIAVWNNQCVLDGIRITNPARHGFVVLDKTPSGVEATGEGYDCRFSKLYVDGYYLPGGIAPPALVCETTLGSNSVTTAESTAALKIGMVACGPNIAPNTTVTAVGSGTITLSQNALGPGPVTLRFGLGQRGFWNANLSTKATSDSFLESIIARGLYGDWAVKLDGAGDWNVRDCHTYAYAYGGALFQFANDSNIHDNGFDNAGQAGSTKLGAACPLATTSAAFTAGESIEVKPLPVAIPVNTLLVARTAGPGGGPLYMATKSASAAGATKIAVYYTKAAIAEGAVLYQPVVGMQINEGGQPNATSDNRSDLSETAGGDYVYLAVLGGGGAARTTKLGPFRAFNGSGAGKGTTSCGSVFISTSANMWTVQGASSITTNGPGTITSTFQANGHIEAPYQAASTQGLIQFVDGAPGSSSIAAGNYVSFVAEAATLTGKWTVPVSGRWRLRAIGGGGQGGGGGSPATNVTVSGGGGGAQGGWADFVEYLTAGTVLNYQAGAGGSAAGEGAAAGAGSGKGGSSGVKSFWESAEGGIYYAAGAAGGGGKAGGTSASQGGEPGGPGSNTFTVTGGGGSCALGAAGGSSGSSLGGPSGLGAGAGAGAALAATLGGGAGTSGWTWRNGTTQTGTTAPGGSLAASATAAGVEGVAAANGSGAGGAGGGAGAYNAGTQGAGAKGVAGGSGWVDAALVG